MTHKFKKTDKNIVFVIFKIFDELHARNL